MIWSNWNKADKTLLAALVIFCFALCLHLYYPGKLLSDGLLFASEAALVGGIADWFAVTALFRKPLGFPYHTAILPRRREAFIKASITMVQKEFFSRRKIFGHLDKLEIMKWVNDWLRQPEHEELVVRQLLHYLTGAVRQMDARSDSAAIASQLRAVLADLRPESMIGGLVRWLQSDAHDKALLGRLAAAIRPRMAGEEARQRIEAELEKYKEEHTDGGLAQMFAGLAEAMNIVNLEEASSLIQNKLLELVDELAEPDSGLQQELLPVIYEKAAVLASDPDCLELIQQAWDDLLDRLPVEQLLQSMITSLQMDLLANKKAVATGGEAAWQQSHLAVLLTDEYRRTVRYIEEDIELHTHVSYFLYDIIARSALHAQSLIGIIVREVLSRLTDEQLNHLVYDKVEPDLLWIRMNGSIVGAIIGTVLFGLTNLARAL